MLEALKITIYILCFATSAFCTFLLFRGYRASAAKLLLWSGLCFGFLAINSLVVALDILIFPGADLQFVRHLASLAAVSVLLFGFVWASE